MKLRRRRSSWFRIPRPEARREAPLKGQVWTHSEAVYQAPAAHPGWRWLAAAVAVVETGLLAWLLAAPGFTVRQVEVRGIRHLTVAEVRSAAGLDRPGSIFAVDAEGGRQRLVGLPWVRSASIQTQLPDRVVVSLTEWLPVAVFHAGPGGRRLLLSDQGTALAAAGANEALLDIEGPAGTDPRVGARALDGQLVTAMVNIQRAFPGLIGQEVKGFQLDSCGDLTLIARRGWRVYFGRVLTPEQFATLNDKLAALKSIAKQVDYNRADLEYVNVMNPSAPAVKYRSARPGPSPAPTPTPVPACR